MSDDRRLLAAFRVLELGDRRSAFAGALLAQLGAEVILIEPPGGHPTRGALPLIDGQGGPEASLVHHSLNAGKRSVVLDRATPEGRSRFEDLVRSADALIDAGGPAERARRGHPDHAELAALNPGLVHLVVSGFGADGPKADWADGELVTAAAGFQLSITGNADRPPLRCAVPQVYAHACVDGVIGVLAAWARRRREPSGVGPLVDVAAQHSWIPAGFHYGYFGVWAQPEVARNGSHVRIGAIASRFDFPAADGFITLTYLFGGAVGPFTNRLVAWMHEEGACDADLAEIDYTTWDAAGEPSRYNRLTEQVIAFTSSKTKAELLAAARTRRLLIAPVFTLEEVLAAEQFHERGFWRDSGLTPPAGGTAQARRPGALAQIRVPTSAGSSSAGPTSAGPTSAGPDGPAHRPVLADPGPAPVLGADQSLASEPRLTRPSDIPTRMATTGAPLPTDRPLSGLKVLDLTISFAGPTVGRYLADLGATVVKVESLRRADLARTAGPFLGGVEIDTSACFAHYNTGKLGLALDLSKAASRPVLDDLVRWADVLVESFAPGAVGRLGLTDDRLAELNPQLIALSSAMVGQSGPFSTLAGYGNMASALCGFVSTTGWPDRPPAGPMGAYTDIISPRFATALLLAAIEHRDRTGEALRIDFGQGESCLHLLTLGLLDTQINGGGWERLGNDDRERAPHGVYPTAGEDRWVAIEIATDEQWRQLCTELERHDLAGIDRIERVARRRELDEVVARWTAGRPADQITRTLQQRGIPAHTVQNAAELPADEQLVHRHWLSTVQHSRIGTLPVGVTPILFDGHPLAVARGGPCLGEDTFTILSDLLGYDTDRIAELAAAELLE